MKFDHIWHLVWLYNRMLIKDSNATPNVDFMIKTREILKEQVKGLPVPIALVEASDTGMLTFAYQGSQP